MDTQLQAARQARRGIEQVRRQLLSPTPQTVAACAGPLTDAIRCMERLQAQLGEIRSAAGQGAQALRTEMHHLRSDLSRVSVLLRAAGTFYEGYGKILGVDPQAEEIDYAPVNRGAAQDVSRRFVVHG